MRGRGAGASLAALELDVTVEGPQRVVPFRKFADSKLAPEIIKNIEACGFRKPTAIQAYCIPAVLSQKDVVAIAQTGSGKTAAYLAPVLSQLVGKIQKIGGPRPDTHADTYDPNLDRVRAEPLAIVVCPTRELALQIHNEALRLSRGSDVRCECAYGGVAVQMNLQRLGKGCDILIGTPGRLKDLLERPQIISLRRVKFTIIDEADEMLQDNDFQQDIDKIMAGGDANEDAGHQYLMFSATFPKAARTLARQYLQEDYMRIRVGRAGSTHKNVKQQIIWTDDDIKQDALLDLLQNVEPDLTLIFCNSIPAVERLDDFLYNKGLPTAFIHGRRSQYEREDSMRDFILKKNPILVTTPVTARGIDFPAVARVINYDLPSAEHGGVDEYVHRIGRTGRIGHIGDAISFYNSRNEDIAQGLVNVLIECEQTVPDFLEHLKPTDGKLVFDDESDEDDAGAGDSGAAGGGWGADASASTTAGGDGGWGAGESTGGASGW